MRVIVKTGTRREDLDHEIKPGMKPPSQGQIILTRTDGRDRYLKVTRVEHQNDRSATPFSPCCLVQTQEVNRPLRKAATAIVVAVWIPICGLLVAQATISGSSMSSEQIVNLLIAGGALVVSNFLADKIPRWYHGLVLNRARAIVMSKRRRSHYVIGQSRRDYQWWEDDPATHGITGLGPVVCNRAFNGVVDVSLP